MSGCNKWHFYAYIVVALEDLDNIKKCFVSCHNCQHFIEILLFLRRGAGFGKWHYILIWFYS